MNTYQQRKYWINFDTTHRGILCRLYKELELYNKWVGRDLPWDIVEQHKKDGKRCT